jgi:hypothetical protein
MYYYHIFSLPAGYCFVDFTEKDKAQEALLKLNGKVIPNTNPVCITKHQSSMYYKTPIQYVLQNTNPVCITKHQSSMYYKTPIQYVL